jgi:glycosyltransferase involved in cell wall biosynthesis
VALPPRSQTPFSLLLPVYRADNPGYLGRAFRSSVHEQTLSPSEVIVVRDGPVPQELSQALAALIADSPVPAYVVELGRNVGLARALEEGLAACSYEVIARMDADDVSLPERFQRQLAKVDEGFDIVGAGMYEFVDDRDEIVGQRVPVVGHEALSRYARFHDPFSHPTVVYRKSAVRRAGGYQEMGLMEDYWLFARMIQSGARAANLAEPLVMYRVGDGAYRRRGGAAQLKSEIALQRRFLRTGFTSPAQAVRNVAVRGAYRLVPEPVRRSIYRRHVARGAWARRPSGHA